MYSLGAARKLERKYFQRNQLVMWRHHGVLQGLCVTDKVWGCPLRIQCHNNCNLKAAQPCADSHHAPCYHS